MQDTNAILDLLTLVFLGLGSMALILTRAAIKTSGEEAAKAAIQALEWPANLARELQKTRGVERQELRFKCYGALWNELRPLAIYDDAVIHRKDAGDLSSKLSDWYFSECGGLMLTPQARDFYFALQDLLRTVSTTPDEWSAVRSDGIYKDAFRKVLETYDPKGAPSVLDYFSDGKFENWQQEASGLGEKWKLGIESVAANWSKLDEEARFASLQQVGSMLRTTLATDLESRLL